MFQPIIEPTLAEKTFTIDLTVDNSPPREKSGPHKAPIVFEGSELGAQTELRTPGPSDYIAMEEPTFGASHRHKRRSVTFASPIEYTPEKIFESVGHVFFP